MASGWTFEELNKAAKELGTFSGQLSDETIADNFFQIEKHELKVTNIYMSTWMFQNSINTLKRLLCIKENAEDLQFETEEGVKGTIWGAELSTFESSKSKNIVYLVARDYNSVIVKVRKIKVTPA